MSNRVPEEWEAASLRELCTFSGGSAFKEKYQGRRTGEYPFIKVSDMNIAENQRFITKANHWIDQKIRIEAKVKLFPPAAVVFAKVGAALLLNRRRILTRETAIDNNMMAAIPKNDDDNFLYYVLQEVDLGEIVQGGAVPSVNQSQMEDVPTLIPPLPEQKKIAAILSSVEEVIEKTRAQIDKLKDLKTGMMQELLAKGIGHTEFKDSPVGLIPMSWEVSPLISICNRITDGTHQAVKTSDYGKIPFLYVSCIRNGEILWSKASALTESDYEIASKGRVACPGDILYTAVGSYGHAALVETDKRFSFQRHIAFIQPDKSVVDPYFLVSVLNSTTGRSQADTLAIGNAQLTVTLGDLGTFMIPIPPIHEQKKISKIIKSSVNNIREYEAKLEASLHIKKALMQDLLTGKVRVNVEARELADA